MNFITRHDIYKKYKKEWGKIMKIYKLTIKFYDEDNCETDLFDFLEDNNIDYEVEAEYED